MIQLRIFNSMTGRKELFSSETGNVGVYVCGITPYDVTHLGHAFTYTFFDVVVRYLRYLRYGVTYVQNLTDIDDDILKKAEQENKNWRRLAEENTQKYLEDMRWLNNLQPDVYPKATDHIEDAIHIVMELKKKSKAYEIDGNVYFNTNSDKEYGKLSKLSRQEMLPIANEHGNDPNDPKKRDPLDFVLWQAKKPGEPSWRSPWGEGRPGWHIECSTMSMKYLGESVDIHGGGGDLKFPHHESSIAQSEHLTGKQFVKYWMHTGMVRYKGEKMSKSLGNLVLLRDLKEKYSPNIIRTYLLSHHYRSVWEFKDDEDEEMIKALERDKLFKKVWLAQSGMGEPLDISEYEKGFFEAMNDDFNTPVAMDNLKNLADHVLKHGDKHSGDAKAFLNKAFNILGLAIEYE
ncbi:MAG: cysteine--tRNA ligase [Deltaproteobacteria bacterium]|nr:cysteine--tRNA ligase [Deltaproteobacteria bacterium]